MKWNGKVWTDRFTGENVSKGEYGRKIRKNRGRGKDEVRDFNEGI
jgi:hypothetical protein